MCGAVFSEQWLRHLWEHRLYNPNLLRTADEKPVTVFSPGLPNYDSGPDFQDAVIRIGHVLFRGDVELHVHANDWTSHGHHLDLCYNSVILHVALHAGSIPALTASKRELPLLLLTSPAPPPCSGDSSFSASRSEPSPLHCPPQVKVDRQALLRRLSLLGLQRLEMKISRMEERLRDLVADHDGSEGHTSRPIWEQLLYEAVLEALGYAKNREPFRQLARTLTLTQLRRIGLYDHERIMAALFGTAGLLPSPRCIPEAESRRYLWRLRQRWKELRPQLNVDCIHETAWKFFRLRPANLPTARLASLVFLLPQLFAPTNLHKIFSLLREPDKSPASRLFGMRTAFAVHPDDFWTRHLYFGIPRHQRGIALGRHRIDDILVNAFFPCFLLYARTFHQTDIERNALLMYRTFPPLQRNRSTHHVERFLTHFPLATAQLHQGALEWVRQYCGKGLCCSCPLAHH
jgi:hypothetical protein